MELWYMFSFYINEYNRYVSLLRFYSAILFSQDELKIILITIIGKIHFRKNIEVESKYVINDFSAYLSQNEPVSMIYLMDVERKFKHIRGFLFCF